MAKKPEVVSAPPPVYDMLFNDDMFADLTGATFRGFSMSQTADGHWNVVIRVVVDEVPSYAMCTVEDRLGGLVDLLTAACSGDTKWFWRFDRFFS